MALIQRDGDTMTREIVIEQFVAPAAHDLIDQLCRKGYLNEENDGIRISDSD